MSEPQFLIPPEMVPISGLNPFFHNVSPARQVMFTGNLAQANVLDGRTRKRIQSGLEREISKATFKHSFDRDSVVLAVIPRFNSLMHGENFAINPMDLVVFEDYETRQLDVIELTRFHVMHQHYGFRFDIDEDVYSQLTPKARIPAGTVIARSPAVTPDGDYMYGLEAVTCPITDAGVTEDGLIISESFAKRLRTTGYETRTVTCGRNHYLINAYGNADTYKPLPDIGEKIHSNGLICAARPYHPLYDSIYMSRKKLFKPVYGLDTCTYGIPDATVVDIKVLHNRRLANPRVPAAMSEQLRKYYEADKRFYIELIRTCLQRHGRQLAESSNLSPRLWGMLYDGIALCGEDLVEEGLWPADDIQALRTRLQYRGELLDEYRIDITFEYKTPISEGPKATDLHGGKGVVAAVWKDEDMPVDKFGNRAEVLELPGSVMNRMNPGRNHEQVFGAAGRDVIKRIRRSYGLPDMGPVADDDVRRRVASAENHSLSLKNFEYVLGFYRLVCAHKLVEGLTKPDTISSGRYLKHLVAIIHDGEVPHGLYLQIRSDSGLKIDEVIAELEKEDSPYHPEMSEVTYRNMAGELVTTRTKILIGPKYYLGLEKTATDWSGVSSSKVNHFGVTARLTNADKYSKPGREVGTRALGESEDRNHIASYGAEVIADNMDLNNNPTVHKQVSYTILTHPTPTNIERVVDRELFKLGGHRPLAFAIHQLVCSGKNISTE